MNLPELTAAQAAAMMRTGALSAETYARALVERADRLSGLRAFTATNEERLLEDAVAADILRRAGRTLGSLHGVPLVIKDNIDVAGLPTGCNTPPLAGNFAATDAKVVRRLKGAGGLILGKTSMHELALGSPREVGNPVNPYRPDAMTGGSSSGTAVAVAARLAPGGLGTDTGGSVRIPAAHCGIAGLRPTLGRYPSEGVVCLCPSRDTAGPMARTVEDLALIDSAITGDSVFEPARLTGLRLGIARRYFLDDLAPESAAFVDTELTRLRAHGVVLVNVEVKAVEALNDAISFVVLLHEAPGRLRQYLDEHLPDVSIEAFVSQVASPGCRRLLTGLFGLGEGSFPSPSKDQYEAAISVHRPALIAAYQRAFDANRIEAIVYPTTPLPAGTVPVPDRIILNGRERNLMQTYLRLIDPSSNAGLPGVTVPGGRTMDGVPLGLSFDGPAGSDRRLLAIGAAYQAVAPPLPAPVLAG